MFFFTELEHSCQSRFSADLLTQPPSSPRVKKLPNLVEFINQKIRPQVLKIRTQRPKLGPWCDLRSSGQFIVWRSLLGHSDEVCYFFLLLFCRNIGKKTHKNDYIFQLLQKCGRIFFLIRCCPITFSQKYEINVILVRTGIWSLNGNKAQFSQLSSSASNL